VGHSKGCAWLVDVTHACDCGFVKIVHDGIARAHPFTPAPPTNSVNLISDGQSVRAVVNINGVESISSPLPLPPGLFRTSLDVNADVAALKRRIAEVVESNVALVKVANSRLTAIHDLTILLRELRTAILLDPEEAASIIDATLKEHTDEVGEGLEEEHWRLRVLAAGAARLASWAIVNSKKGLSIHMETGLTEGELAEYARAAERGEPLEFRDTAMDEFDALRRDRP